MITTFFIIIFIDSALSIISIVFIFVVITEIFIIVIIWLKTSLSFEGASVLLSLSSEASSGFSHLVEKLVFLFAATFFIVIIEDFLIFSTALVVLKILDDFLVFLLTLLFLKIVSIKLILKIVNIRILLYVNHVESLKLSFQALVLFLIFWLHILNTFHSLFCSFQFLSSTFDL